MAAGTQDFKKGIDFTVESTASAALLNQHVDNAVVADDRGMIVSTTDTAVGTPDVPNPTSQAKFKRFTWLRKLHADDPNKGAKLYFWNDYATSDATYLKWTEVSTNIIVNREVNPDDFGADASGVANSTKAIRRAIYKAKANGGYVKFKGGTYKLDNDVAYAADESQPYLFGTSYAVRDRDKALLPLLDNTIIDGNGATLLAPILADGVRASGPLISGLGYKGQLVENLIIDGQHELQGIPINNGSVTPGSTYEALGFPVGNYPIHSGGEWVGVVMGNDGIIRHNRFKKLSGLAIIPGSVSGTTYTSYRPYTSQTAVIPIEPHCIVLYNNTLCHGNIIDDCWDGGIIVGGCFNKIHGNIIRNVGGHGIDLFFASATSVDQTIMVYKTILGYLQANKYATRKFKGIDLGTLPAITSGFFAAKTNTYESDVTQFMTDEELDAKKADNNYNKSVQRYFAMFNEVYENTIGPSCKDCIHLEQSLVNIIHDNKIVGGIPQLSKPGVNFALSPVNGSYATVECAIGISVQGNAGEVTIYDNDFYTTGNLIDKSASSKVRFAPISSGSYWRVIGSDSINKNTFEQDCPQGDTYGVNRIHGLKSLSGSFKLTDADGTVPIGGTIDVSATDDGESFSSPSTAVRNVNEVYVDGPIYENAPTTIVANAAIVGKFKTLNPVSLVSREYVLANVNGGTYAANGNAFGTKRMQFRIIPMRRDQLYKIDYKVKVFDQAASSNYSYQSGTILFRYTSSLVSVWKHTIHELDWKFGAFDVEPFYNELFPQNKSGPSGRLYAAKYRGGLAFYFNSYTISNYNWTGSPVINSNIVFEMEGEITPA